MAKTPTIKPGEEVPDSGIWESDKSKRRATLVEGEPAPPTPKSGEKWKQKVDTNPPKKSPKKKK
jgi:hypothetical protein